VHGPAQRAPAWLPAAAELVRGDIRDAATVRRSLAGVDLVYHLAAVVGVAQSMYQVDTYTAVNTLGTANLLQALVDDRGSVERVVVAASMSIYGEGRYTRPDGRAPGVSARSLEQLRRHEWELRDSDGVELSPTATDEAKPLDSTPLAVHTHSPKWNMAPDLPDDLLAKMDRVTHDLYAATAKRSTDSSHKVAERAGHGLHVDEPELVITDCDEGTFRVLKRIDGRTTGDADAKKKCAKVADYTNYFWFDSPLDTLDYVLCLQLVKS
jgi:hypothetical protein